MKIITWSDANILYVLYLWPSQSITVNLKTRYTASERAPNASSSTQSERILRRQSDPTEFLEGNGARISPDGPCARPLIISDRDVVPFTENYSLPTRFDSFGWSSVSSYKTNIQTVRRTNAKCYSSWLVLEDLSWSVRLHPDRHGYRILGVQFPAVRELHVASPVFRELQSSTRLAARAWGGSNIVQNSWAIPQGTNVFSASLFVEWENSNSLWRLWLEKRHMAYNSW